MGYRLACDTALEELSTGFRTQRSYNEYTSDMLEHALLQVRNLRRNDMIAVIGTDDTEHTMEMGREIPLTPEAIQHRNRLRYEQRLVQHQRLNEES